MEVLYRINNNGTIIKNGVAIPMIEGTTLHEEYVQYLRDGGTVVQTDEQTSADTELLYVILPNVVDLNGENNTQAVTNVVNIDPVVPTTQLVTPEGQPISSTMVSTVQTVIESAVPNIEQLPQIIDTIDANDDKNIKIGKNTLIKNKKGIDNVAVGFNALNQNISSGNVGVGKGSLATSREAANNTAVGRHSLAGLARGTDNVAVGSNAGKVTKKGQNNNQSFGSVFIGANTRPLEDSSKNEIVIGVDAIGNGSNTTTIGNEKTEKTIIHGVLKSDGYLSSDGSVGITATFKTIDGLIVTIKNGLVVSIK
jgi:Tfp pilus assembly protein PilZ